MYIKCEEHFKALIYDAKSRNAMYRSKKGIIITQNHFVILLLYVIQLPCNNITSNIMNGVQVYDNNVVTLKLDTKLVCKLIYIPLKVNATG